MPKAGSFHKSGPENLIDFKIKFIVALEYPAHIIFRTKIKEALSRFHCLEELKYLNHVLLIHLKGLTDCLVKLSRLREKKKKTI